jgi:hypothetical protein
MIFALHSAPLGLVNWGVSNLYKYRRPSGAENLRIFFVTKFGVTHGETHKTWKVRR